MAGYASLGPYQAAEVDVSPATLARSLSNTRGLRDMTSDKETLLPEALATWLGGIFNHRRYPDGDKCVSSLPIAYAGCVNVVWEKPSLTMPRPVHIFYPKVESSELPNTGAG